MQVRPSPAGEGAGLRQGRCVRQAVIAGEGGREGQARLCQEDRQADDVYDKADRVWWQRLPCPRALHLWCLESTSCRHKSCGAMCCPGLLPPCDGSVGAACVELLRPHSGAIQDVQQGVGGGEAKERARLPSIRSPCCHFTVDGAIRPRPPPPGQPEEDSGAVDGPCAPPSPAACLLGLPLPVCLLSLACLAIVITRSSFRPWGGPSRTTPHTSHLLAPSTSTGPHPSMSQ